MEWLGLVYGIQRLLMSTADTHRGMMNDHLFYQVTIESNQLFKCTFVQLFSCVVFHVY